MNGFIAAALTDAGLLLVVVTGGVAILVFVLFAVREVLSRPVELPRELPPPHDLPPIGHDEGADEPPVPGADPPVARGRPPGG